VRSPFPKSGRLRAAVAFLLVAAACGRDEDAITAVSPRVSTALTKPAAAVTAGTCDYDASDASLTGTGWTKVFDEPFASGLSRWSVWTGGAFNEELQLYQAANLQVSGGLLNIAARKESVTGPTTPFDATPKQFGYTSGRIESRSYFSSSRATPTVRLSARLKLPNGYGMWPAFWSYGDPWPTEGEIDIMESRGQEPFTYYTAYWYGRRSGVNLVQNSSATITSSVNLATCWHVYEVIWTKNDLTYLFDGQVVDVKSGGYIPNMFRKQQRITLNLAVGGLFFPNLDPSRIEPGTLQADWVKVFVRS
jgi:beta-glucanase (GH16 family)